MTPTRLRELLERFWPRITAGDPESIARRDALREAWRYLGESGVLDARVVGMADAESDATPVLVMDQAWEAAVCRIAGLSPEFTTKAHALAYYGNIARPHTRDFDRWWSGLETKLLPIASALLSRQVYVVRSEQADDEEAEQTADAVAVTASRLDEEEIGDV